MQSKTKKRRSRFSKRLAAYSAVAGAASLSAGQATDGAVDYTPGPFGVGIGGIVDINFDGSGDPEFLVYHSSILPRLDLTPGSGATYQKVVEATSASTLYADLYNWNDAVPLKNSFTIGPTLPGNMLFDDATDDPAILAGTLFSYGNFKGANSGVKRYVGVKFDLTGGGTHYGWIGLIVDPDPFTATVVGYAYETAPDTAIHIPEPTTLSVLALGCTGVAAFRRSKRGKAEAKATA